jgi:MoaA/NifB/PqqE/SkfB family radical SAM enzyme
MLNIFKKPKPVLAPNILLTNTCNQECPYCFARQEMKRSKIKEMSLENFKKVVNYLKKNKINSLRLMGGEPTIHSRFQQVIKLGINNFGNIVIFTNGLIPKKNKKIIEKNIDKISFNFNIDTPAFEKNDNLRDKIVNLVKEFSEKTNVNIGFTLSDLRKRYESLIENFHKKDLSKLGMRFGFAKAIIGEKPFFEKKDYKKLGKRIISLVKFFKSKGIKNIYLDCGLKKEMFFPEDLPYLKENIHLKGWGCKGKWSSFDIAPDLTIFPCFPYYKKLPGALLDMLKK